MGEWMNATLERPDGAQVQLYERAADKPKAIVHINHGMAEHAGRYARFADALAAAGYAVIAHDHRGHGKTTAPGATLGHFGTGRLGAVIEDIQAVQAHAREKWPGAPLVSFGHSMGCILALANAVTHPASLDALAPWNSGVETGAQGVALKAVLWLQAYFRGSDVPSPLVQKLTFEAWNKKFAPNRTEFDWLSRDEAEVDKYIADPLCGFDVTIALWQDVVAAIYRAADDDKLAGLPKSLSVYLIGGENDPCTEGGRTVSNIETRMKKAGMSDVTCTILPETRHESLNELNRERTTADFISWLDERFGKGTKT